MKAFNTFQLKFFKFNTNELQKHYTFINLTVKRFMAKNISPR